MAFDISGNLLYDGTTGGGQKLWFAVLLGFIFAILASGIPYNLFLKGSTSGYLQLTIETVIFTFLILFILN